MNYVSLALALFSLAATCSLMVETDRIKRDQGESRAILISVKEDQKKTAESLNAQEFYRLRAEQFETRKLLDRTVEVQRGLVAKEAQRSMP